MTRKFKKIGFKQTLIMDVALASILVQLAPGLLNRYLFSNNPLTGLTGTAAGVGTAYVLGAFMNKPDMVNAAIALGGVELVAPILGELTGVGSPMSSLPAGSSGAPVAQVVKHTDMSMADFLTLNDSLGEYISAPAAASDYERYKSVY